MTERALIIAIETYKQATDRSTAKPLDGTVNAAMRFREWLEEKWKAEGVAGSILFCSEPRVEGQLGAGKEDLIAALSQLQREGRNTTDNLYVYFSGHGFSLVGETLRLADVLVTADFKDVELSAGSCFRLGALIDGLRSSLRHGCHFYFIDACRNEVEEAISSEIMKFKKAEGEEPSVFVLQSTVSGAPSLVGGPFAKKLLEGLRGAGTAKVWEPPAKDSMKVRFDSLRRFLKDQLQGVQPITQSTSGEKGENEAVLATIKPVPQVKLTITIKTALVSVQGKVRATVFGATEGKEHGLTAKTLSLTLPPNNYNVAVIVDQLEVSPVGEVAVELYQDRELTFLVSTGSDGSGSDDLVRGVVAPSRSTNVHVDVPQGTEVFLRHLGTGVEKLFGASELALLPLGDYTAELRTPGGPVMRRREIRVRADEETAIAPAQWKGSLPHESIAAMLPQQNDGVDFSESLEGAITDPDLNVWLALLGGGRVLGATGDYHKIARLPLTDFSSEPPGASPVYLLAGLPDEEMGLRLGLSEGRAEPKWLRAREPQGMKGLREVVMHPSPGQVFLTLGVGKQPGYTLASFASPNRCTLIVLTIDEEGEPRVAQYLLPLGNLVGNLDPEVQQRLYHRNHLKDVKVLALLSRAFRKRRRIADEFSHDEINQLLFSKWLDPIGASLATYECVRRGKKQPLREVARNMQRFFPDLPDTSAIIQLAGAGKPAPHGVPLFLDGLRAFPNYEDWLPYPAGLLDFSGPWTAWRGAVSVPSPGKLATYNPGSKRWFRFPRVTRRKAK